jgi:hypothetical protein
MMSNDRRLQLLSYAVSYLEANREDFNVMMEDDGSQHDEGFIMITVDEIEELEKWLKAKPNQYNLYRVAATAIHNTNDRECTSIRVVTQVPTFLLDADQLGIVSEAHATEIAKMIVCPFDLELESVSVEATVVKI